jgi:hypothetical protein
VLRFTAEGQNVEKMIENVELTYLTTFDSSRSGYVLPAWVSQHKLG